MRIYTRSVSDVRAELFIRPFGVIKIIGFRYQLVPLRHREGKRVPSGSTRTAFESRSETEKVCRSPNLDQMINKRASDRTK